MSGTVTFPTLLAQGLVNNPSQFVAPCPPVVVPLSPTVAHFRMVLPEFRDSSLFLDETIFPWLRLWSVQLPENRWLTLWTLGVCLATAHSVALSKRDQLITARGGVPGMAVGVVSSKAVSGVSISYDTNAGLLQNAGDWNLTTYGVRFLGLARMVGSAAVQIRGADSWAVSEADLLSGTTQNELGVV